MVHRWMLGMGLPIWHLIDEQEEEEEAEGWEGAVDYAKQLLLQF